MLRTLGSLLGKYFNFDDPRFIVILLAVLVGLRLVVFLVDRLLKRQEAKVSETAAEPEEVEDTPLVETPVRLEHPLPADGIACAHAEVAALPLDVPVVLPERPLAPDLPQPELPADPAEVAPAVEMPATAPDAVAELPAAVPDADAEPPDDEGEQGWQSHFFAELLDAAIIAVVLVFFIIRPFVLQAFYIPSGSMFPTLQEGDKLLATKFTYYLRDPRPGDVVVFHAPKVALNALGQEYDAKHPVDYVKRVVGVPHDRIRIVASEGVYVNDTLVKESRPLPDYDFPTNFNGDLTMGTGDEAARQLVLSHLDGEDLVVPEGYLFVLGDNRTHSHDGHVWGLLERKAVVGRAMIIFWPPNRWGWIK